MMKLSTFLVLASLLITFSCSKDKADSKSFKAIGGTWYCYELDGLFPDCDGKITGKTNDEKWASFFKNFNGKKKIEGCDYFTVEYRADGTCWVAGTKFCKSYKLSDDKTRITLIGIEDGGSSYDEDMEVKAIDGNLMMTTSCPLLSSALGPCNSFSDNSFLIKQ